MFKTSITSCSASLFQTGLREAVAGLVVDTAMQGVDNLTGVQKGWNWSRTFAAGATGAFSALASQSLLLGRYAIVGTRGVGCRMAAN